MIISASVAQSIVAEIGEILHENINMMDEGGYIIASMDKSRIGDLHEGAKRIIDEGLSELYITKKMESPTVKQGINLPIVVDSKIVGVVGITGNRKTVMPYGTIVKRMTEIMVADAISKQQDHFEERIRFRFIGEWLSRDDTSYDRSFIQRGSELGLDVQQKYRVMAINVENFSQIAYTQNGQQLLSDMEHRTRFMAGNRNFIYMRQPPGQMLLIPEQSDEMIHAFAKRLTDVIAADFGLNLIVGIDSSDRSLRSLKAHAGEARIAAGHESSDDERIVFFDSLDVELLLHDADINTIRLYLKKFFKDISEEEQAEWIIFIDAYFEQNGSISRIADRLFLHKNTIQNRIHKLNSITGKDIRLPRDAAAFSIASACYKRLHRGGEN